MRAAPSLEEVRRQNLGALLRSVHRHGAISRAELTSRLGLNRSTIGALTADLAAAGLVTEQAPAPGRGADSVRAAGAGRAGRPSLVVTPRSEQVCAYALSIGAGRLRAARVGLGGVVLDRFDADRTAGAPVAEAVTVLAAAVGAMRAAAPATGGWTGCGVAVCGRSRAADGSVSPVPPVDQFRDLLRDALGATLPGAPVTVAPAADLAALAEHTRGVATGCDNLIYLHGDAGITAGIIAGGRPVTGHGGVPGDVGHMVVQPGGHPCGCGSRGCWEVEAGEQALLRTAGPGAGTGDRAVRAVVDAAARGDSAAKAAVRRAGDWLGFGVGNLVNVFNPDMVVFGESLREIYLAAAAPLRSRLHAVGLVGSRDHLKLRTPALGTDAALLGAAELAFESLLVDPLEAAG